MAPYWVGVSFDPPPLATVEVLDVRFVGKESGALVKPSFSAAQPLDDGSGTVVSEAAAVQLRHEDYEVRLHVRAVTKDGVLDEHLTGTLRQTFEQRKGMLFWETLMGI
jgi:hypothetical protein